MQSFFDSKFWCQGSGARNGYCPPLGLATLGDTVEDTDIEKLKMAYVIGNDCVGRCLTINNFGNSFHFLRVPCPEFLSYRCSFLQLSAAASYAPLLVSLRCSSVGLRFVGLRCMLQSNTWNSMELLELLPIRRRLVWPLNSTYNAGRFTLTLLWPGPFIDLYCAYHE